jgi:hypothetical protein
MAFHHFLVAIKSKLVHNAVHPQPVVCVAEPTPVAVGRKIPNQSCFHVAQLRASGNAT